MVEKKEKFYVFLDFDGVLYDVKDAIKRKLDKSGKLLAFSQDSIEALNTLMDRLSIAYSPELVISSTWRCVMPYALRMLKKNGFDFADYPISRTGFERNPLKRGLEIKAFLKDKPNSDNFVIIDDGLFDYPKHFNMDRVIRTGIVGDRLTLDKVESFLSKVCSNDDDFVPGQ